MAGKFIKSSCIVKIHEHQGGREVQIFEDEEGYLQVKANFKQWGLRYECLAIVNG